MVVKYKNLQEFIKMAKRSRQVTAAILDSCKEFNNQNTPSNKSIILYTPSNKSIILYTPPIKV